MKKIVLIIGFIFCSSLLGSNQVFAAPCDPENGRIVVVPSGQQNCTSMQTAIDSATGPTIIDVMPGTYTENITVNKNNIHLQGSGPETTIIEVATSGVAFDINNVGDVRISGFSVKGASGSSNNTGIWDRGGSSAVIDNNEFSNLEWPIYLEQSSSSIITNNKVSNSLAHGIEIFNSSPKIIGNIIDGSASTGIRIYPGSPLIEGNEITNNTNYGIEVRDDSHPYIYRNKISGNDVGIRDANSNTSSTIRDNDITDNVTTGIYNMDATKIYNNRITNNGLSSSGDIALYSTPGVKPSISFNVVDDIQGTAYIGCYNVKTNGTTFGCYSTP